MPFLRWDLHFLWAGVMALLAALLALRDPA